MLPSSRPGVFHGGLQLAGHKAESTATGLSEAGLPPVLVLPLTQHVGLGAIPVVEPGQAVLRNQLIARADGDHSGSLHAPTSGRIRAVEPRPVPHPGGLSAACMVLEPDGRDQAGQFLPPLDPARVDFDTLLSRVRDAGIVGLGGAVFPTASKIRRAARVQPLTVVINGAECEPYISCDDMLMRTRPREVVRGARLLLRALGAREAIIAVERDKALALEALEAALAQEADERIRLERIFTIYPAGGERQLIQVLGGREVPFGGLPIDVGFLCQNVATVTAILRAVEQGEPLVSRITTVTGTGIQRPSNFVARLGTPVDWLARAAGGYHEDAARLIMGGPMMGISLASDEVPLVKASNCVLVMRAGDLRQVGDEMPCIRCGDCERVCPASLQPQELYWRIRGGDLPGAGSLSVAACIECGCCDFACPSHIPLAQYFRYAKTQIKLAEMQRRKSDLARERFEQRNRRLEGEKDRRKRRLEEKRKTPPQGQEKQPSLASEIEAIVARKQGADEKEVDR